MHVNGESSIKRFLEESVHFQNEVVITIYLIIFAVLSTICIVYYQLSKRKAPRTQKLNDLKQEGQL